MYVFANEIRAFGETLLDLALKTKIFCALRVSQSVQRAAVVSCVLSSDPTKLFRSVKKVVKYEKSKCPVISSVQIKPTIFNSVGDKNNQNF
jgi:hypothetical protein